VSPAERTGPGKRATFRVIAKAAGVSPATVSHVYSGHRPVSAEVERRVLELAEQMGYTANSAARGLSIGRAYVVALHVPFSEDDVVYSPFLASSIVSISTALAAEGYATLMLPSQPHEALPTAQSLIRASRIDAALMLDPSPDDAPTADEIDRAGLPVVTVGKLTNRLDLPWVDGDVPAQFSDALDHLSERGYRAPALVTFPGKQSFLEESETAFRAWCRAHKVKPVVYKTDGITDDSTDRCVEQLRASRFDSILCADDMFALSMRRSLIAADRADVAIIGTGNSRSAQEATPGLTSIATHAVDRGRHAAALLIDLVNGKEPASRHIVVPHQLAVRDSTPQRDVASRRH
jgi:LacI family transcriptional regulator